MFVVCVGKPMLSLHVLGLHLCLLLLRKSVNTKSVSEVAPQEPKTRCEENRKSTAVGGVVLALG